MSTDSVQPDVLLSLVVTVRRADDTFSHFLTTLRDQHASDAVECIFVAFDSAEGDEVESMTAGINAPHRTLRSDSADVAAARRRGVSAASGAWLAFPDGQDALAPEYLSAILGAIRTLSDAVRAFRVGGAPLERHAHAPAQPAYVDTMDDEYAGLTSDVTRLVLPRRSVPSGAPALTETTDELLIIDLLDDHADPDAIAVLPGDLYLRRRRPSPDPQTEFLRSDAQHYLQLAAGLAARLAHDESASGWRHHLGMRSIKRLIGFEHTTTKRATTLHGEIGERFRADMKSLLQSTDPQLFHMRNLPDAFDERRDVLFALSGRTGASPIAHVIKADRAEKLMEVRQSIWGDASPAFTLDGVPVVPRYQKRRVVECFGPLFEQVIAWVPASGATRMQIDGADIAICHPDGTPVAPREDLHSIATWRARRAEEHRRERSTSRGGSLRTRARRAVKSARKSWLSRAAAVRLLARTPWVRAQFHDAWLLMDRADMGRDNAEHFYRWLAREHPEVNSWYVLRADSADFSRLRDEGFRMVEYGSLRHQLLLNNTKQYLSSHVGIDVSRPIFDRYLQRDAPWTFTFLQHGVIHNDLSTWLNRQSIRTFLTSTHGEFNSLSGESPYVFTTREMKLTGLPRFDKLRRVADAAPPEQRKTIVIAPTWRNSLFLPPAKAGELRKPRPGFIETPFIRSLLSILNDPRLHELADRGYTVKFVPHPNLAAHFPYEQVPSFVTVTSYAQSDVQELIGTAAVFLTDYSSVAFDAAFADAAVVYMHLDGGAIYGQDHTLFPGYFDFERDGFGPVCESIDDTISAVVDAIDGERSAVYRQRARDAFAYWDSGACERVFTEVKAVERLALRDRP